jgi:hypothetical protein
MQKLVFSRTRLSSNVHTGYTDQDLSENSDGERKEKDAMQLVYLGLWSGVSKACRRCVARFETRERELEVREQDCSSLQLFIGTTLTRGHDAKVHGEGEGPPFTKTKNVCSHGDNQYFWKLCPDDLLDVIHK